MNYFDVIKYGLIKYACDTTGMEWLRPAALVVLAIAAYLIGSVNFGVLVSRRLYHDDVRSQGSGNPGATNMLRTYGLKASLLTFLGDALKGSLSAAIGLAVWGYIGGYVAFFFVIFGHAFPVFFKFRGGKGIATAAGALLVLNTTVFIVLILIFSALVYVSKYVSAGSIIAAMVLPLLVHNTGAVGGLLIGYANDALASGTCTLIAFLAAVLVVFLHRKNLVRLMRGEENKISIGKKDNGSK